MGLARGIILRRVGEGESDDWKKKLKALGIVRVRKARPAVSDRRKVVSGREGEDRAATFLKSRGLRILARNVRYRDGEIDLVGEDGATFVFVEVKRRRDLERGSGAEAVTRTKRERVLRASRRWLAKRRKRGASERPVRFDVVALRDDTGGVEWIRGAFDASDLR